MSAIVFDLDDTLYPERQYAFSGFRAVAGAFADVLGEPDFNAESMRRLFESEHRPRVFDALLAELGRPHDPELIQRMIATYRSHTPSITLHPDADACLSRFRGRCLLGLLSDGPLASQTAKIEALGLRGRFDAILLTDELGSGYGKPHSRSFELIAERLQVSPSRCVYVGDNPRKDFIAANALGWITIQILRADGIYRDQVAAVGGDPNHIISTLAELDRHLPVL